jgi:hypothetical protein
MAASILRSRRSGKTWKTDGTPGLAAVGHRRGKQGEASGTAPGSTRLGNGKKPAGDGTQTGVSTLFEVLQGLSQFCRYVRRGLLMWRENQRAAASVQGALHNDRPIGRSLGNPRRPSPWNPRKGVREGVLE